MLDWICMNFNGILVGIITTAICGVATLIIGKLFSSLKNRKSEYTGEWEQLIYNNGDDECQGKPIKQDRYELIHSKHRHSGNLVVNVHGTIRRIIPSTSNSRQWKFIGYLNGNVLTILYQAKEGQRSRGCIYLRLVSDFQFKGYYLEEHKDGTIDKTPLIIRKVRQ